MEKDKIAMLITITVILTVIPMQSFAGSWNGWVYQNPYPTSNNLLGVKFVTSKKGWVAGEQGIILFTEDAGETWAAQESGIAQDLLDITFVNEKNGWAVGNRGIILHTGDGGKTWAIQSEIKAVLKSLFFLNEKEGWAVGADGKQSSHEIKVQGIVLHTIDGGKKWETVNISINRLITSVYFINPQTGWLLAGDEVYRTTNGGKKWEESKLPVELPFFGSPGHSRRAEIPLKWDRGCIFFTDDKNGWAVIGLGSIFHSKDGGKTWVDQLHAGSSYALNRISFMDKRSGCTAGSTIFCTADEGKTWKEKLGVLPEHSKRIDDFLVQIHGISFPRSSFGWAVGDDGQIMKTEDGGKTWKMAARRDECGSAVFFVDKKTGWIYAPRDYTTYICRTDDGGRTRQNQEVGIWVRGLFFSDSSTGWAVGTIEERNERKEIDKVYGVIKYTADGGKTWSTQFKELMGHDRLRTGLFEVSFIDRENGWVVGNQGMILHTTDGGKRWEHQASGSTDYFLRNIHFLDTKFGWIIGTKAIEGAAGWTGIILYTEDGGKKWNLQHKKDNAWLNGIFFTDNKTGWVTGRSEEGFGWLLFTEDGGNTWTKEEPSVIGYDLIFLDKDRGVIPTTKAWFFITTEGGKTWKRIRKPVRKYPWHVSEVFECEPKNR